MSARRVTTAKSKRRTVLARDGGRCHYCSEPLTLDVMTLDHIWPRALGGGNANSNLVAACQPCNESRGEETDKCRCDVCTFAMRTALSASTTPRAHGERTAIASIAEVAGFRWTSQGWQAYRGDSA